MTVQGCKDYMCSCVEISYLKYRGGGRRAQTRFIILIHTHTRSNHAHIHTYIIELQFCHDS